VTAMRAVRGRTGAAATRGAASRSATIAPMRSVSARTLVAARTPHGSVAHRCADRRDAARNGIATKAIKTT